jgi:hypothetical protein
VWYVQKNKEPRHMENYFILFENQVRRLRRVSVASSALAVVCCVLTLYFWSTGSHAYAQPGETHDLRLRSLTIVDEKGTPRIVLAAPLPDPKYGKRPKPAAGILIFDDSGSERGGYVTSDGKDAEAYLTLDNAAGGQAAMFLANAQKGATLVVTNADGDAIGMTTAFSRPVFQVTEGKKVIFKQPPDAPDVK